MTRQERFRYILSYFNSKQPNVDTELEFGSAFQLLVATLLSAQCTDKRINAVTPALFAKYPTAKEMAKAETEDVLEYIKSVSYPNSKAQHLVDMARMLVKDFDGEVPSETDKLTMLPGVGRKTANVVQAVWFGKPTLAVDTHVYRVAHRLGLVSSAANTPLKTEQALMKHIPTELVNKAHHWLLLHGRYTCTSQKPKCDSCELNNVCPKRIKNSKLNSLAIIITFIIATLYGCSSSKFIPTNEYLLDKVSITSDDKHVNAGLLEPYIRQKGNSKWFSFFKIPLATYSLSGRDSTKWMNRTLQRIGEKPVILDTMQMRLSQEDLANALHNMGYMHAIVKTNVKYHGKKADVNYTLHPGEPYYINKVDYNIMDDSIAKILRMDIEANRGIKSGDRFTVDVLDNERKRITSILLNNGYYRFHKDFIQYDADSARNENDINIKLNLLKYRANDNAPITLHPRYTIGTVNYKSGDEDGKLHLRESVIKRNTRIEEGMPYRAKDLQRTYNNFARLQAVRYTNIRFHEHSDTTILDCDMQLSTNKPNTISFQPEGTNTAGNLGAAASLTYSNRNLFRGSELFSVELRGAFEAIKGLEGYKDQDYQEYNIETKLQFPRFIAPFISNSFKKKSRATSELSLSYNLQKRPEFHRRVFSAAWRYRWNDPNHHSNYRIDLVDFNYIRMPWISPTFKHDYLDSVSNRNAILRYNYEDLLIMKVGFALAYNNGVNAMKANIETAGNLLHLLSATTAHKHENGQYTYFDIAYAQYVKGDFDFTHLIRFDEQNSLALHFGLGIAYPYGNSKILPFEKRYFSGGANSVRGWGVRELGPGKFRGTDGRIDFINQTGDMKLDINAELRSHLFWKLDGAFFIDGGNIWTIRQYDEQPGGQFKWNEFYKQIAVAYGLGLRLNFDYFILRFDLGMKAINPAYDNSREHYAITHPKWHRDSQFHFAVGLPF